MFVKGFLSFKGTCKMIYHAESMIKLKSDDFFNSTQSVAIPHFVTFYLQMKAGIADFFNKKEYRNRLHAL